MAQLKLIQGINNVLQMVPKIKPAAEQRRPAMAPVDSISVPGSSGMRYSFEVYPWGTTFRSVGGVYLILRREWSNGRYDVLYIGQTGDLSERFDDHHKKPCFDRNGKTHIGVMVETSGQRRLNIEGDLLQNYRTSCNN